MPAIDQRARAETARMPVVSAHPVGESSRTRNLLPPTGPEFPGWQTAMQKSAMPSWYSSDSGHEPRELPTRRRRRTHLLIAGPFRKRCTSHVMPHGSLVRSFRDNSSLNSVSPQHGERYSIAAHDPSELLNAASVRLNRQPCTVGGCRLICTVKSPGTSPDPVLVARVQLRDSPDLRSNGSAPAVPGAAVTRSQTAPPVPVTSRARPNPPARGHSAGRLRALAGQSVVSSFRQAVAGLRRALEWRAGLYVDPRR